MGQPGEKCRKDTGHEHENNTGRPEALSAAALQLKWPVLIHQVGRWVCGQEAMSSPTMRMIISVLMMAACDQVCGNLAFQIHARHHTGLCVRHLL